MTWAGNSRQGWAGWSILLACLAVGACGAQTSPGVQATTVEAALPEAVAYDAAGNLYIALRNAHSVRKIDAFGVITTVAGSGQQGFGGDGGSATSALLDSPQGIAVDAGGTLYIADSRNHRVRAVVSGIISTIAGTGVAGFSGDSGSATAAQLDLPTAVSVDASGNLFVADTNNQRIRRISAGVITTVAGSGQQGFGGDGGVATAALLDSPMGIAVDPAHPGSFYIADTHNQRIRLVDASGNISTTAGTGAVGFSGDGAALATASVANPRGLSVDASGDLFIADSGNQRIRAITAGAISTVAGNGEQGFGGDPGLATSAILDTPRGVAVSSTGSLFALADTHNQRVRAVSASVINTVAGIPPALTEGLILSGPTSETFGTSAGRLTATFSSPTGPASGSMVLNVGGRPAVTAPVSGNTASFDLGFLSGGLQALTVSYGGDSRNAAVASGVYLVDVLAAAQTITFPPLATPVTYSPGLTATLSATASSGLPVTFSATGPATVTGSTLTYTGPGTVVVTATQAGNANYTPASASQTISVSPSPLVVAGVSPNAVTLGVSGQQITVTGSGFTATSVIRFNGVAAASVVDSATQIRATLPQPLTLAPIAVSVYDPVSLLVSSSSGSAAVVTVTPASATATLSVPGTSSSGQQPSIALTLQTAYPVALSGVYTLTFAPSGTLGVDDPAIQFPNGSRTYPFTIPANSTAVPSVPFQTGTVAGTVTVSYTLSAGGTDVTPATGRTAVVVIPGQAPTATTVSFVQSGPTLTVTVVGFSNVRNVAQATFNFTPAAGTSLETTSVTLPVTTIFNNWFSSAASSAFGSVFTYTQVFNLSDAGAKVQTIGVTLTNSVGASVPTSSP